MTGNKEIKVFKKGDIDHRLPLEEFVMQGLKAMEEL